MPSQPSELDAIARELVALYRDSAKGASGDAARTAALRLGRALEAIERARRSTRPENAYEIAIADIADARKAMDRLRLL